MCTAAASQCTRSIRHVAQVTVIPAAIAASYGLSVFCIAKRTRATNHLAGYGSTQTGGVTETQTVVTLTLDWLLTKVPAPNIIKIDVEGAELEVLSGALEIIKTIRPVVICEVGSERTLEVSAFFRSNGYKIFDGETRKQVTHAVWTTVAMPE